MLDIKNTVLKIYSAFDGLVSTLHVAEERIAELKDIPIETYKTENQQKTKTKNLNIQELLDNYIHTIETLEGEEKKGTRKFFVVAFVCFV